MGRVLTRVPQGYLVEPDPEHQGKVIWRAGRERERERERKPCVWPVLGPWGRDEAFPYLLRCGGKTAQPKKKEFGTTAEIPSDS